MADAVHIIAGPRLETDGGGVIIELDASISQSHELGAEVTDHPVEDGVDITDHVRPKPARVTIQGVVSAHPLVADGQTVEAGREIDAWAVLEEIILQRLPVTLVTTLRVYQDVILLAVSTIRQGERAIYPQLELRQIRRAQQQVVTLPPERIKTVPQKASGPTTQDVGRQPTDAPTAAQTLAANQSAAAAMLDFAGMGL